MKKLSLFLILIFAVVSYAKKDPEITLVETELLKGLVTIKIPKEFKQMNDGKIKANYQGLPTIKMAYASSDETVRIALGSDQLNAPDQVLPKMTQLMKQWLQGRLDKNKWKGEGVTVINDVKFGYLEYILKKPEKYYEFMFFTLYRGQMLSCSIHSPKKGYKFWKGVAEEMMTTLTFKKEKE